APRADAGGTMRLTLLILLTLCAASALGLGATWLTVERGLPVGGLVIGPWRADPGVGGLGANPYQRAGLSRRGEAPLAYGDGLAFTATTDQQGRPLSLACDYTLAGDMPAARLWTLAAFQPDGRRVANALGRFAATSAEAVRVADRPTAVTLSREARPGDWLPLSGEGPFVLRLNIYETAVGTPLARSSPHLFTIERGACR
ncbi:DUF1214 domain-containing protein, partial [Methylopila musalis]